MSSLFGSVKTLLSNIVTLVNALSDDQSDLSKSLSDYALKSSLSDGSVTKVGTATVGNSGKPIYWNSGSPSECDDFSLSTNPNISRYKDVIAYSADKFDKSLYNASGTIVVGGSANYMGFQFSAAEQLETNTNYVISFYIQKTSGTFEKMGGHNGKDFIFNEVYCDDVLYEDYNWQSPGTDMGSVLNDGKEHFIELRCSSSSEIPEDSGTNYLYIQPNRGSTEDLYVTIRGFKFEKGSFATPWCPAVEDGSVGVSTVGAAGKPIYNNSGILTACSSTIGGVSTPVYMSSGTITACSSTVGAAGKPIYSNGGVLTACSSTIGSASKPVFMSSGTITACSSTVGSSTQAVYFNSGTVTACSSMLPLSGGTMTGSISSSLVTSTWINGCKGTNVLLNSTASAGSYVAHLRGNATDGAFTLSTYQNTFNVVYMNDSTINAGTNSPTYRLQLLTSDGQTILPGNTSYTTYQARNIAFTTSTPSSLTNGYICMVYS